MLSTSILRAIPLQIGTEWLHELRQNRTETIARALVVRYSVIFTGKEPEQSEDKEELDDEKPNEESERL